MGNVVREREARDEETGGVYHIQTTMASATVRHTFYYYGSFSNILSLWSDLLS